MFKFDEGGWWLPDGEEHLQQWMLKVAKVRDGRLLYQGHKYERAIQWVKKRGVALDVGAHVGLWTWPMAKDFRYVHAFEPMREHRDCWIANLKDCDNVRLWASALGNRQGVVRMKARTPGSSGDTGVDPVAERSSLRASVSDDGEAAPVTTIDSVVELLDAPVDFIKIDCEGYELYVLQGAQALLERDRPCIIVEQKPETGMTARYGLQPKQVFDFLEALGAKKRASIQGDFVYSWD